MTQRHNSAKPANAARSIRLQGFNQALLLAACGSALLGIQACGSSDSDGGGGAGSSSGGAVSGAGAPAGGGASGNAPTAGASTAGAAGAPNNTAGAAGASTAGAAGAGTAGAAGAGTAGAGGAPPVDGDDVLERNHHASRDGHFKQPKLTKAAIATMTADAFTYDFDGNMWASPLFASNGPGGKGTYIAVTTGNDVFAFDEAKGDQEVWKRNIGSSPQQSGAGCGGIHPIGILSTPVIDAASRTLYVAGAIGTANITKHEIHALNLDDGTERAGWPVDTTGTKSGATTFNPQPQNQRSALSLVNGKLYVAYGGHVGDCGNYHGWGVAIDTANPTSRGAWATLDQGSAIWAAGGMASDGTSIFAVTGNHTGNTGGDDRSTTDSEQVVRLGGLAVFDRSNQNLFFPTSWKTMDSQDADFGSSNPIYLTIPGSTPSNYIMALAKDGKMYLLNASNLGGMGGSVVNLNVANGAMSVKTAPAAFTTAKGTHVVFSTDSGAACPGGGAGGPSMISVLLTAGSPPKAAVEWCAPLSGPVTAPIATTTDGTANAAVWYMNNGKLTAVDGDTGMNLYTSANSCSGTVRWTSPIAVKGHIVVGGNGHLCSWSVK